MSRRAPALLLLLAALALGGGCGADAEPPGADAGTAAIAITKVSDPHTLTGPFQPERGRRFIAVTFKITSRAGGPLTYEAGQFHIAGDDSKAPNAEVPDRTSFNQATVAPGRSIAGRLVFEVAKSEQNARLVVQPPPQGGKAVDIPLRK